MTECIGYFRGKKNIYAGDQVHATYRQKKEKVEKHVNIYISIYMYMPHDTIHKKPAQRSLKKLVQKISTILMALHTQKTAQKNKVIKFFPAYFGFLFLYFRHGFVLCDVNMISS